MNEAHGDPAQPAGREPVDLGGVGVHFKIPGAQTGGAFAVVEHPVDAGVIVEPHVHQHEDELSYVLHGTVWARVGDHEVEAAAGTYLWKPRGVLHTFWNPGPEPAHIIEVISPAGFEVFFAELGDLLTREPTDEEVGALCDRYGLTFDHGWLPEIQARFGPLRVV
jgi:mannose-6-phosphate isomerase-like protein (cupin superfamily)